MEHRVVVAHGTDEGPDAHRQQHRQGEHDRRVPEAEPEPDRERPRHRVVLRPVAQQLASRVVDRRDVVGVERVPHAEGVGQQADAHREDGVVAAERESLRDDEPEQDAEAHDVQDHDDGGHAGEAASVGPVESVPPPLHAWLRVMGCSVRSSGTWSPRA